MRAVNLLPSDLRAASSKGRGALPAREPGEGIGAFVLLGALALCVAAFAGYVLSNNVIKERKATLAQVSAESDATVKRAADLKPYADFQDVAQARVGTVQALANSRFDWEQALRDLSKSMPSDVHLSSLSGTTGSSAGGAGAAASGIRGAINAPAIELKGCTSSQPAVAAMMSRLRNIDGVTRVSLSKSDKEVAATQTGSGTSGSLCKGSRAPSFEVVVFFEGAAADVALAATTTGETPAGTITSPATKAKGAASASASATPAPSTSITSSTPKGGTTP